MTNEEKALYLSSKGWREVKHLDENPFRWNCRSIDNGFRSLAKAYEMQRAVELERAATTHRKGRR